MKDKKICKNCGMEFERTEEEIKQDFVFCDEECAELYETKGVNF